MKWNGIRHIRTAPYHPASNGQAERAVKIVKDALKKSSTASLQTRLSRFLFHYRLTPHSTTGIAPAELLLGRRPHSHLDLVKPDLSKTVEDRQFNRSLRKKGKEELILVKEYGQRTLVVVKFRSSPHLY